MLLLVILGWITYYIVKRSVTGLTRTPIWVLWLVMMTPPLLLTVWALAYGTNQPPPWGLLGLTLIACPVIYWYLIQAGRKGLPPEAQDASPAALLPAVQPPPRALDSEEESKLQGCFPWSVYYLQKIEYQSQAVICRGQLRTSPTVAYQTVSENVTQQFGDRFLVVFQENLSGKPIFALVPNPQAVKSRRPEQLTRPFLALGLLIATLLTTTLIGAVAFSGISETDLQQQPALLLSGLSYSLPLLLILGVHELGHYLAAQRYRIQATLPYFIPIPFFIGTFGAFIQMRSPIPNRKALFDIGIAGPLSGLVVTIPCLIWGLIHSQVVALPSEPSLFNFEALDPKMSFFLALLSHFTLGNQLTDTMGINLHPVAVAGFLGLVVTALNLMPVGQLDGGHVVHAMFGQRTAAIIGQVTRLLVLILALARIRPEFLFWALILLFMPVYDEPALNDVSELDNGRDLIGLLSLALLLAIILPAPKLIVQFLYG